MMEGLCQPSRGDVCLLFSPSQPNIHLILPYPSYSPPPPKIKSKTTQKNKIRLEFEKKKKIKYRNACTNLQLGPTLLSDEL